MCEDRSLGDSLMVLGAVVQEKRPQGLDILETRPLEKLDVCEKWRYTWEGVEKTDYPKYTYEYENTVVMKCLLV